MTDRVSIITALIGKTYQVGASGPDAFDCYGLASTVQREIYAVAMAGERPSVIDAESTVAALVSHPERRMWHPALWPADGDLVVMANVKDQEHHLGTYVVINGVGNILHITEKSVVFEDRNSLLMRGYNDMQFFRRKRD